MMRWGAIVHPGTEAPRPRWRLWADWDLDVIPLPRAGIIRGGDRIDVWASIGPKHTDPILHVCVAMFRR